MKIRQSALDAIFAHATRDAPNECCGLLIGAADEIQEAVAARNVADDPRRRYEVSPADHFAQIKRCRQEQLHIVGVYHSHPHSQPVPSPTDLGLAFTDFLFVIAGAGDVRGYRLNDGAFEEVRLERTRR